MERRLYRLLSVAFSEEARHTFRPDIILPARMNGADSLRFSHMSAGSPNQLDWPLSNLIWKRWRLPNCAQPFPMVGATHDRWTRNGAISGVDSGGAMDSLLNQRRGKSHSTPRTRKIVIIGSEQAALEDACRAFRSSPPRPAIWPSQ